MIFWKFLQIEDGLLHNLTSSVVVVIASWNCRTLDTMFAHVVRVVCALHRALFQVWTICRWVCITISLPNPSFFSHRPFYTIPPRVPLRPPCNGLALWPAAHAAESSEPARHRCSVYTAAPPCQFSVETSWTFILFLEKTVQLFFIIYSFYLPASQFDDVPALGTRPFTAHVQCWDVNVVACCTIRVVFVRVLFFPFSFSLLI